MKVNPIFQKEMRMMWRSPVFILSVIGVNMVLSLIALLFMAFMKDTIGIWNPVLEWLFHGNGVSQMSNEISYNSVRALYILMASVDFLLLLVVIPAMTVGTITWEREHQTLDLLLTTQLPPSKIVVGKLLAMINIIFTLLCSTLPIFSLVFVFGGLTMVALLELLVVLLCLMAFVGSIGLFCSSFSHKTWRAAIANIFLLCCFLIGNILMAQGSSGIIDTKNIRFLGALVCLALLLNPFLSFLCLLQYQLGGAESFVYYLEEICHISKDSYVANHWLWLSLFTQLCLALLLVYVSGYHLLPRYASKEAGLGD